MEVVERSLVFRIGKIVLVEFGEKPGSSEPRKIRLCLYLRSRNHGWGLIRVHTFRSARIHCCSHVIVCHPGLDSIVGVGGGCVECRVDLRVRPI